MQTLDIVLEDPRWQTADLPHLAETATRATLEHLCLAPDLCELTLLACDDARITTLNADFRDKPQPTNVLSWPSEERSAMRDGAQPTPPEQGPDGMIELGDIAISYDTCASEAAVADKPISAHVTHLIVHGVLHLLGYDHMTEADGDLMERIEVEILGKLGHDNPYLETAAPAATLTRSQD